MENFRIQSLLSPRDSTEFQELATELVNLQELNGGVVVANSLKVRITYTSRTIFNNNRARHPSSVIADSLINATVIAPGQLESKFLTITRGELYPDGNLVGNYSFTKEASPLGSTSGIYTVKLYSKTRLFRYISLGSQFFVQLYPSIQIFADDQKVVDVPYSPPDEGEREIQDSWLITYKL